MNAECLQSSSEEGRLLEVSIAKTTLIQIRKFKEYQPYKTLNVAFWGQLNITFINEQQLISKKNLSRTRIKISGWNHHLVSV